jgi:hypothetical protein
VFCPTKHSVTKKRRKIHNIDIPYIDFYLDV